jgi:hypothetical protein
METQQILIAVDSQTAKVAEISTEQAHRCDMPLEPSSSRDERCSGGVCRVGWKPGRKPAA